MGSDADPDGDGGDPGGGDGDPGGDTGGGTGEETETECCECPREAVIEFDIDVFGKCDYDINFKETAVQQDGSCCTTTEDDVICVDGVASHECPPGEGRVFRSNKTCAGTDCGGPDCDALVYYKYAHKALDCDPRHEGQVHETVIAALTCDGSKASDDPDRWSVQIQTAQGYFNENSANNPDAAGSCAAPPKWTFNLEGNNVRAGCCKEGNTHGACCRSYGLDIDGDGAVDTFGNEMLDESDPSYGEPFFQR